ncbi:hypothetical protein Hdeb2414_s0023g00632291 [Helianthus debilis subsp. tardiflorus]
MRNSQWQLGLKMVKGLILVPKTDCLILMMQLCSDFHQVEETGTLEVSRLAKPLYLPNKDNC